MFNRAKDLPTWRRIAANAWSRPTASTIYGSIEIDAGPALDYIARSREAGTRLTITHLVAKAVAGSIASMPEVNGIVARGTLWLRDSVDIFVQVSLDDGASLSGAIIRKADKKSVEDLALELTSRVEKIRAHTDDTIEKTTKMLDRIPDRGLRPLMRFLAWLQYDRGIDLSKAGVERDGFGSAMVTNVGMFGLQQGFAPLFPLGRTPILVLVGEVTERPMVVEGKVEARPVLGLHATLDHRIIDGYQAGLLAGRVRDALTKPETHMS